MAQLVERLVRNEKASGSNPLISTKKRHALWRVLFLSIIVRNAELSAVRTRSIRSTALIFTPPQRCDDALAKGENIAYLHKKDGHTPSFL